jgi:hypothetical protein
MMKEAELPQQTGRLYQRFKNKWIVKGYICHKCSKYYHSLRRELFDHVNTCEGPIDKRKLED